MVDMGGFRALKTGGVVGAVQSKRKGCDGEKSCEADEKNMELFVWINR